MSLLNTPDLLEVIRKKSIQNRARVAIGVRDPTKKIIASAEEANDQGFAEVVLVGDQQEITSLGTHLEVVGTSEPEKVIVDLLVSGYVDAAVRGTARASDTLSYLKKTINIDKLHRVALLTTAEGTPFFIAPVGIDEGEDLADKMEFARLGSEHISRFGIEPVIGFLSGGRMGDVGRNSRVDRTLADGEFLSNRLNEMGIKAKHYTILIEDAIKEANFIIAPDGISGNLIFRTLVFLGCGDGMGAPVLMDKYVFVDTSRVGGHYTKAIMVAGALSNMNKSKG
ncbi:methanogenesis marker protein Mmp4/MtxX [uncultured Methanomethylovorans sp.]|uniref:methanogenesis marker protein Mmp4/MtxX n=1 Tax=uncultured Methanomethylovorans sp. TaxID=183759 RepID=UPI002AA8F363|nr:methanogenesis marker protein Mmp4/MtxX [uncultured Methanomethylovorans sp.]